MKLRIHMLTMTMFQSLWPLFVTQLPLSLLIIASPIVDSHSHQNRDALRDALDVLARKQRSLDVSSQQTQNYYDPLRAMKYSDDSIMDDDDDDDERDLDFISMNNPNQLEDIDGNDFQRINDVRLLMDSLRDLKAHLKTQSPERDNEQSLFRERERIGNHKRDTEHVNGDNYDHQTLAQMFLDALYNSPPYDPDSIDEINKYSPVPVMPANDISLEMFQPSIYDEYKNNLKDEMNIDDGRRSLVGIRPMTNRQMAMDHYPIEREYMNNIKRFPVAKRSGNAKKLSDFKSPGNTDPEVAQDLKSLFGSRTMADESSTASPNKLHHNDNVKKEHNYDRAAVDKLKRLGSTTNSPITGTTILNTGGQNEIEPTIASLDTADDKTKMIKNKIKKSIDWSQYFGIDRRRKKTEFLARPGTQEQDDEWLLQQYYKTIAENLRKNHFSPLNNENKNRSDVSGEGGGSEKRDKLQQIDDRLKNVKNLIMKDAAKYSMSDNDSKAHSQEVKDVIMARLAAAYSLEKMRLALNDFKNSIALERPAVTSQNSAKYTNDNSSNKAMNQKKRTNANNNGLKHLSGLYYDGTSDFESSSVCPELDHIETSCKPIQHGAGYALFVPCVMYKICRLCEDGRVCATELLHEANRVCENNFESADGIDLRKQCSRIAIMILSMQEPRIITRTPTCYDGTLINSCLRRYQQLKRPTRYHNINDITNEDLNAISEQHWK